MKETAVVEYNVTDAALAKMEADYMGLTVKGLDDKDGFDAVHKARMIVKGVRVDVEKTRKALKASALEWGRKCDSEAKKIFDKIEPIETHLTTEEEKITKEKERIAAEKAAKEEARVNSIRDRIEVIRSFPNQITLSTSAVKIHEMLETVIATEITEAEFQEFTEIAKSAYAETVSKIESAQSSRVKYEAEESERKAESERLAKERAELDRIRAEEDAKRKAEEARMKAERDKLDAERKALEAAKREEEQKIAIAQAKKEAAERAIQEAKEQAEREARDKAAAELKAKEEAERQAALKPDKERLMAFAQGIMVVTCQEPKSIEAKAIVNEAMKRLLAINRYIIKSAQEL